MRIIQDRTKTQIRQSIGSLSGQAIIGTASSDGLATTLVDTYGMARGGDNEYKGRQVYIPTAHTSGVPAGEKSVVSSYTASSFTATLAPTFTAITKSGGAYEMWKPIYLVEDIHDMINQAIIEVSRRCLQPKQTVTAYTENDVEDYDCLSGFEGVHTVEYVNSVGIATEIDDCDTVWTAGSSVTATVDTSFKKEGTASVKLVVAVGAAAGAVLGYGTLSAIDISDCDYLEFWLYSSVALTAGYLDIVLDDTAACVTPIESIDIPATSAATWTRHVVALANPHTDTAIISVGLVNTTDVGVCTLYIDDVKAIKRGSRKYRELNPQYWRLVRGSTNYLRLTTTGHSIVGSPTLLRISGYALPALLTADTATSEIDPEFIVSWVLGYMMLSHAKARQLDFEGRQDIGKLHAAKAESMKSGLTFDVMPDSRML